MYGYWYKRLKLHAVQNTQPPKQLTTQASHLFFLRKLLLQTTHVPPLHPEQVVQHGSREDIKRDVHPHKAEVPPALAVVNVRSGKELICDAD